MLRDPVVPPFVRALVGQVQAPGVSHVTLNSDFESLPEEWQIAGRIVTSAGLQLCRSCAVLEAAAEQRRSVISDLNEGLPLFGGMENAQTEVDKTWHDHATVDWDINCAASVAKVFQPTRWSHRVDPPVAD